MQLNKILAIVAIYGFSGSLAAVVKTNSDHQKQQGDKTPWNLMEAIHYHSNTKIFSQTWMTDPELDSFLDMQLNKILAVVAIYGFSGSLAAIARTKSDHQKQQGDKTPWHLMEAIHHHSNTNIFNGTWMTDNTFYYRADDSLYHKFYAAFANTSTFAELGILNRHTLLYSNEFLGDSTKMLIEYNLTVKFRHSLTVKCNIVNLANPECDSFIDMQLSKILSIVTIYGFSGTLAAIARTKSDHQKQQGDKTPWHLMEAIHHNSNTNIFNGTWMTDNTLFYPDDNISYHKFNPAYANTSTFDELNVLNNYVVLYSNEFSPDNTKILIEYDNKFRFRFSVTVKCDIVDLASWKVINIHGGKRLQLCIWSPSQDRVAYVFNNNVFIHFGENEEIQLTSDGIEDIFFNGVPDWVYEEDVVLGRSALWWSNDGNFLAVGVYNDTNVGTLSRLLNTKAGEPNYPYPKVVSTKYPMTGSTNPIVSLKVFNVSANSTYVTIKAPEKLVSSDNILQSVVWTSDNRLLITWLNRRQNVASLQLCSVVGVCREIKHIEEPKGWIQIGNFFCLKSKRNCLFTYWIDNWYQIWNLDLQTGENIWRSRGNFTVLKLYGYDEANDIVYYRATLEDDPTIYHVFGNSECLTCDLSYGHGEMCYSAEAAFSKDYSYYAASCLGPNPGYTKIFETRSNKEVKFWKTNTDYRNSLQNKVLPEVQVRKIPLADGSKGMAKLYLPPNLDKTKKYPMILEVYGAPNFVWVTNDFAVGMDTYMAVHHEVIYVKIDSRGSANMGKDILFSVNNRLGQPEVEDRIFATKYLQSKFKFVDKNRVGIWGESYGGYITALTLANDKERVFKCGIAKAPVSSLLLYNSIYSERYMGLPSENFENYTKGSVFNDVSNFRNHDFLLIHGAADDNAHIQNSFRLSTALQSENISFQQMIYPEERHKFGISAEHYYSTMQNFWSNCLKLEVEEEK